MTQKKIANQGEIFIRVFPIAQAIADRQGTLWIDIENAESASTREAETLLREDLGFHSLAVEDAIDKSHIPKIDDWGEYIYLVFHGTSIDPRTDELRLHEPRHLPRPQLYAFRQFHAPLEIYRGLQTVLIVSVSSRTAHRLLTASSCNAS